MHFLGRTKKSYLFKDKCLFLFGHTFVAAKLGIQPPPPYLSLAPNDDAILKGVNYASGGAGILNDTGLYFVIYLLLFLNSFILLFFPAQ